MKNSSNNSNKKFDYLNGGNVSNLGKKYGMKEIKVGVEELNLLQEIAVNTRHLVTKQVFDHGAFARLKDSYFRYARLGEEDGDLRRN